MFLTIVLFLLIFFLIIRPLWRVYMAVRRGRQQTDDFFRSMGIDPEEFRRRQRADERGRSRGGYTPPREPSRKKKIDPNVGEYVEYEEVKTTTTTASDDGKTVSYTVQQQVSDAEWEDVK